MFHFAFRWLLILKTLNRRCFFANFYGWNTLKTKFLQLLFRFAFLSVKEQCVSECAYLPVSLWVCVWLPCHCLRLMLLPLRGWHWTVAAFWIIGLARVSHNNTSSVLSVRFVLRRLSLMLRDSTEYNVFLQYLKKKSKIKLHVDHLWSELLQIMFMCGEDVMHTEWTLASVFNNTVFQMCWRKESWLTHFLKCIFYFVGSFGNCSGKIVFIHL